MSEIFEDGGMEEYKEHREGPSVASRLSFEVRQKLGRLKDRLILERCGIKPIKK